MNNLIIIPARGGSKGVPGKNIKLLNGKPLIQYTIDVAKEVSVSEHIIVSTDDDNIKSVSENTGLKVPFLRPAALAADNAGSREVILHAIDFVERSGYYPEIVILLQPTSPFRQAWHIKEALEKYKPGIDMVVSVKETKSNPYYVLFEEDQEGFLQKSKTATFTRRQDCPAVWEINGAVYIINVNSIKLKPINEFKKVLKYPMDEIFSLDIDTFFDWQIAECIINSGEINVR